MGIAYGINYNQFQINLPRNQQWPRKIVKYDPNVYHSQRTLLYWAAQITLPLTEVLSADVRITHNGR